MNEVMFQNAMKRLEETTDEEFHALLEKHGIEATLRQYPELPEHLAKRASQEIAKLKETFPPPNPEDHLIAFRPDRVWLDVIAHRALVNPKYKKALDKIYG